MQEEKQCPNCRSFYTKSETQEDRFRNLGIYGILLIICLYLCVFTTAVGIGAIGGAALIVVLGIIAYKYFIVKTNYSHCKGCNFKWGW
jgi:hypothetical protein